MGPAITGSPNVNVNALPALRVNDVGIHAACCGANMWVARVGAPTVFINGKPGYRVGDMAQSCGGVAKLVEGSSNVNIGDATSGGGVGGGSNGRASGDGAATGPGQGSGTEAERRPAPGNGSATSGSATISPSTEALNEPLPEPEEQKAWVDVQLVDQYGDPLAGEAYKIELTTGEVRTGKLDADGVVHIDDIPAGSCKLHLPDEEPATQPAGAGGEPEPRPEPHWIEIEMLDQDGEPLRHAAYAVELPDGSLREGFLDAAGRARLDNLQPGRCYVILPSEPAPKLRPAPAEPAQGVAEIAWLALELRDQDGAPLVHELIRIELPDGSIRETTSDARGRVRLDGIPPGACKVLMPDEEPPAQRES